MRPCKHCLWFGASLLAVVLAMAGCGTLGAGAGISVPVGPVSIGIGGGTGGLSVGVGTGVGPVGVGVGREPARPGHGGAGVGASVPIGGGPARAGVGVGTGTVLYDPANHLAATGVAAGAARRRGPDRLAADRALTPLASLIPRMDLQPGPALFLQPHYDDVALSCGATVAAWAAAGSQPRMVTVFASELVEGMVGEFAERKHSRWNVSDLDAVPATRRSEDERAAAALGCSVRWLGLPDAIYRGDRYTSDASLYGAPHPEELPLADHLAEELLRLPEWRPGSDVFVSLGVGDHVDHQLVFEAGRRLAQRGVRVWAYEDLPYGIHTPRRWDRALQTLRTRCRVRWCCRLPPRSTASSMRSPRTRASCP